MTDDLRMDRVLAARPDRVWRALTDPAALCGWFWPQAVLGTTADLDLRVGGRFRIDAPKAGIGVSGRYLALEPSRRLEMTWQWLGEQDEMLVAFELAARADPADPAGAADTRLTLLHRRNPDQAALDRHRVGWTECLDRLPARLAAAEPIAAEPIAAEPTAA